MWQLNFVSFFDIFVLQSVTKKLYYKVWQIVIRKCFRYYKVRQVLQNVTVITKWDVTAVGVFIFFILEEANETVLDLSEATVEVLLMWCTII